MQPRLLAAALSSFSALAFLLAAIGVYTVVRHNTAQRASEFGVRMALGATRSDLISGILKYAAGLAGFGILLGLAAACAFARVLASLTFGIPRFDPVSFAGAPLLFFIVALCAALIPAFRLTRVAPADVLRSE
ncbi:MAG: FtsX-like permease family protein [Acidobacteriota bacterium]|nr:FtsX-like permease family protein [Acidobacteriota bacterium]